MALTIVEEVALFWTIAFFATAFLLAVTIWFMQQYYAKATREVALVRTGLGGQKVVVDGGCISLPIVHQIQRVSMGTMVSSIKRDGAQPLLAGDKLPADIHMEFEYRVSPTKDGVAVAAQTLGQRISRDGEAVGELLGGKFIDAMQNAAAGRNIDEIHNDRAGFSQQVADELHLHLDSLGLTLVAVSLTHVDQGTFSGLDENNAFNAEGMRKLALIVAENRKERIRIETEAEIAIRESHLIQAQRQLEIERAEREAEIAQREHLARLEAEASALTAEKKATAARIAETAELEKNRELKALQVAHDEALRKLEMAAIRALEEEKITNEIRLSEKRMAESEIKAAEEKARSQVVLAAEAAQTVKARAVAERDQEIAQLQVQKEAAVQTAQTTQKAENLLVTAQATAKAETLRQESEARGRAALINAENGMSDAVIAMKLEEHKLDRLPEIMTQMMKPVEKIESIRINQIGGLGGGQGSNSGNAAGVDSAFGAAMDQILGMAVSLPAMKKMGEEIGVDFDPAIAGRTADYANRIKSKTATTEKNDKPTGENK